MIASIIPLQLDEVTNVILTWIQKKVLLEMATMLNTGLDRDTMALCVSMCERGVNPEALAVSNTIEWMIEKDGRLIYQAT